MTTPRLLHDLLDVPAASTPASTALTRGGESWTYEQLAARSRAVARRLTAGGVRRGDRVVVISRNEPQVVATIFGVSRIGAIFVLVSDQVPAAHRDHILTDSGARAVVVGQPPADAPDGVAVYRLDELAATEDEPTATPTPLPVPCLSIDPVCLIYTSGSTALPKAVVCPHRQVLFAATAIASRLHYRPDDTVFCCLPLSFDYGLYQVFLTCVAGARLVLGDDSDAGPALANRLEAERVTVLPLVPSLAVTLCRLVTRTGRPPRHLRMVTNTGADLSAAQCARLRAAIPGLRIVAMFGLTECKRIAIAEPDLDLTRPGSVGRPLPDTEVFVVDGTGTPVPAGTPGELVVRGPHVMAGYWNAPEITARRYRRDELGEYVLHTGDRARLDADGYLYFLGRDDDVYKQHGFRVSTVEVEAAALGIPRVEMAAALPGRDGRDARLAVCGAITVPELTAALRTRLEPHKVPPECRVVERLPLGVNGKVDKRALAAEWDARVAAGCPDEPPRHRGAVRHPGLRLRPGRRPQVLCGPDRDAAGRRVPVLLGEGQPAPARRPAAARTRRPGGGEFARRDRRRARRRPGPRRDHAHRAGQERGPGRVRGGPRAATVLRGLTDRP
ncbi:class I adenylate-forming enzyme family protein [Kibdelosporangium lantanae]